MHEVRKDDKKNAEQPAAVEAPSAANKAEEPKKEAAKKEEPKKEAAKK